MAMDITPEKSEAVLQEESSYGEAHAAARPVPSSFNKQPVKQASHLGKCGGIKHPALGLVFALAATRFLALLAITYRMHFIH